MLRIVGYIPHADLPAIYNGAFAFLYTSLRESFGIPILEAMACGTPVITSDTSAIPEIAGRGAMLVDPTNPDEIAARLVALESDEDIKNMEKLLDMLDDNEDVQNTYHNWDQD